MYRVTDSTTAARYVGLASRVAYRIEAGTAFVDDGDATFRLARGFFERLIDRETVEPADAEVHAAIARHPSLFVLFPTPTEAEASIPEET